MPYIKQQQRIEIDHAIHNLIRVIDEAAGSEVVDGRLNYTFTTILRYFYGNRDNTCYSNINAAIGLLGCVKEEYYRTVAAPYEDKKIEENGDL